MEHRQRLGQSQMTFDNLLGYNMPVSMCMLHFITIVHSFRPFSLFQNLEASRCRSVTLVTEFSICTSQPLKILIIKIHTKMCNVRIFNVRTLHIFVCIFLIGIHNGWKFRQSGKLFGITRQASRPRDRIFNPHLTAIKDSNIIDTYENV